MIFEFRTTEAIPGGVAPLLERIASRLAVRTAISPLGACWRAEIGPLSEIVEVWPYDDLAALDVARAALSADPDLGSDDGDLAVHQVVELWRPAPFMTGFEPRDDAPVVELRTYSFRPGTMAQVLDVWAAAVPERETLSPLIGIWTSDTGSLHRLRHAWAYRSLDERARIRHAALAQPLWPPMTREWRVGEESQILLPAAFSPIR